MPKIRIQVAKSLDVTWQEFTNVENWDKWWVDGLITVAPYWTRSARMVWNGRTASTITSFVREKELTITDAHLIQHFRFFDSGYGRTNIEMEFSANCLTVFEDKGLKQAKIIREALVRFKKLVEGQVAHRYAQPLGMAATQKSWWQVW